jgi:hypothetical protein
MAEDRPPPRSPDFDELTQGWGSDSFDDLVARCELLLEYWRAHFPLPPAELKVARAMIRRMVELGGIEPVMMQ